MCAMTPDFRSTPGASHFTDDIAQLHARTGQSGGSLPTASAESTDRQSGAAAWSKLAHAYSRLGVELGRAMRRECGLSLSELSILMELEARRGSPVRTLNLARDLQWERSRLSHQLSHMTLRGLVSREEDPRDRRASLITISEKGRQAVGAAAPRYWAVVNSLVFARLSTSQVSALAEILGQILDGLEDSGP